MGSMKEVDDLQAKCMKAIESTNFSPEVKSLLRLLNNNNVEFLKQMDKVFGLAILWMSLFLGSFALFYFLR